MDKADLRRHVVELLARHGHELNHEAGLVAALTSQDVGFEHHDTLCLTEIIWELLMQGVLAPGFNSSNEWFPWLHVTERGQAYLAGEGITPLDPEGYVEQLVGAVCQPLDQVLLEYIQEGAHAFYSGCTMASAVMIGVASERCIDMLTVAYSDALSSATTKADFNKRIEQAGRSVKRRFEVLRSELLVASLPQGLADSLDVILSGVFNAIRYSRNDAGHPTGVAIDQEVVHASLSVFPTYCKRVYALMSHLQSNSI